MSPDTYSRLTPDQTRQLQDAMLGELSAKALQLRVGQTAPQIEGTDIDGVPFKLGDYRGKVIVLVFSGSLWCSPCRQMHPQERELVERLKGERFALLHVNSDYRREEVKGLMEKGEITWRSWWDGPAPKGPISKQWSIQAWPTVYVLDHHGDIRHKDICGDALDRAVNALIEEMKADAKRTR